MFVQEQSLATVCRIANSEKADVFVSIHCNAAENKSANGTETFYWTSDTKSRTLANCVQNRLLDALRTRNRGLKDGTWLYVQCNTQHDRDVNAVRNILSKDLEMQKSA